MTFITALQNMYPASMFPNFISYMLILVKHATQIHFA